MLHCFFLFDDMSQPIDRLRDLILYTMSREIAADTGLRDFNQFDTLRIDIFNPRLVTLIANDETPNQTHSEFV
jgi:hypothetical protein